MKKFYLLIYFLSNLIKINAQDFIENTQNGIVSTLPTYDNILDQNKRASDDEIHPTKDIDSEDIHSIFSSTLLTGKDILSYGNFVWSTDSGFTIKTTG